MWKQILANMRHATWAASHFSSQLYRQMLLIMRNRRFLFRAKDDFWLPSWSSFSISLVWYEVRFNFGEKISADERPLGNATVRRQQLHEKNDIKGKIWIRNESKGPKLSFSRESTIPPEEGRSLVKNWSFLNIQFLTSFCRYSGG